MHTASFSLVLSRALKPVMSKTWASHFRVRFPFLAVRRLEQEARLSVYELGFVSRSELLGLFPRSFSCCCFGESAGKRFGWACVCRGGLRPSPLSPLPFQDPPKLQALKEGRLGWRAYLNLSIGLPCNWFIWSYCCDFHFHLQLKLHSLLCICSKNCARYFLFFTDSKIKM